MIALNESHLRRLIREYVSYHHEDRIHDSLEKDTPIHRAIERKPDSSATVISGAARRPSSSVQLARGGVARYSYG